MTSDDVIISDKVLKVGKNSKGWIAGCAGMANDTTKFWEWFYDDPKMKTYDLTGQENFRGIIVKKNKIYELSSGGYYINPSEYSVAGSGWRFAQGVLEFGGTAREAVETAIKCCSSCGGEVQEVSL